MTRWKPLPKDLEPEVAHLIKQMRHLKDAAGLTLTSLAANTPYSKSTWGRYLNGELFPPKESVLALTRVSGGSQAHFAEWWDLASRARAHGANAAETPDEDPVENEKPPPPPTQVIEPRTSEPRIRRTGTSRTYLLAGSLVALCAISLLLLNFANDGGDQESPEAQANPPNSPSATQALAVKCRHTTCAGKNPRLMGCGDDARTSASVWLSDTLIEVRYSLKCQASWGRILEAEVGDQIVVEHMDGRIEKGEVAYGKDAFSPMLPTKDPAQARACSVLTTKNTQCTPQGSNTVANPSSSSGG